MIISCSCASSFQDAEYGKGRRVANQGERGFTCTVCGTLKGKEQRAYASLQGKTKKAHFKKGKKQKGKKGKEE